MRVSTKIAVFDLNKSFFHRRPKRIFTDEEWQGIDYYYLRSDGALENNNEPSKQLKWPFHIDADVVVIFSYRIAELALICLNPHVQFIYMQHGIHPSQMKRVKGVIFKKFQRLYEYVILSLAVAILSPRLLLMFVRQVLGAWFGRVELNKNYDNLGPAVLLNFNFANEKIYREQLGWQAPTYKYPWFEPKQPVALPDKWSGCSQYICQTLVEGDC